MTKNKTEVKPEKKTELEPIDKTTTTIQVPVELKTELEHLKSDDKETYAGVIRRLIESKPPAETNADMVSLTLPTSVYRMVLMVLPGNMSERVLRGVR